MIAQEVEHREKGEGGDQDSQEPEREHAGPERGSFQELPDGRENGVEDGRMLGLPASQNKGGRRVQCDPAETGEDLFAPGFRTLPKFGVGRLAPVVSVRRHEGEGPGDVFRDGRGPLNGDGAGPGEIGGVARVEPLVETSPEGKDHGGLRAAQEEEHPDQDQAPGRGAHGRVSRESRASGTEVFGPASGTRA
ncbi:MAG: hypothetical protein A2636_04745 [Elusimicrobia bacterium RIFCSPHIGHO2_01_FULL_64_10]|nr:MAG: hypothetical protein A2636_04745 [Elusimicrobia bacterium RIFCSPHIGHO2_01_FULL_64_10]